MSSSDFLQQNFKNRPTLSSKAACFRIIRKP
nr:MAG TPA: hypothetical protein [Caudoviricetes sp.]DAY65887.1 MAG TPA: hypothetical protein [Caudoviricetes sp.]